MKFKRRIEKLEEHLLKPSIDLKLDRELTTWFNEHPQYNPFAQPESNNGIVCPEYLEQAFRQRIEYRFAEKNLEYNACNLLKLAASLYP